MERKVEINLLFFKIRITFPSPSKHRPDPLSRAASDWEFYKMKSQTRNRGRSFTKSHLMLDLIANLENIDNSEEDKEEEEEVYTELDEDEHCREELQEKYSQIPPGEISSDYQLPDNCRSEDIYELVETLPLPPR